MTSKKKQKRSGSKKLYISIVILIILIAAGVTWLIHKHKHDKIVHNQPSSQIVSSTGSPSTTNDSASSADQGGAIDDKGKQPSTVAPESSWLTSPSGNITLHDPVTNSTVQSGEIISGTAKVGTVQYRLIDNSVGVIAQGPLSVVNGQFSGTLEFQHTSTTGQFDIYSLDPNTGAEINEIQVPINF